MNTNYRFLFWLSFWMLVLGIPTVSVFSVELENPHSLTALENLVTGLLLQPDGSLLLLENDAGRLSRLELDVNKNLKKIERITDGLIDPIAVVQLKNGDLIIAERKPGRILQLSGNRKKILADSLTDISSLRLDNQGNLWVTELNPGLLIQINPRTGTQKVILDALDFPSDVLPLNTGILLTEMVGYAGSYGKISFGEYTKTAASTKIQTWKSEESLIDPLRMTLDPRNPDNVFVSVRSYRSGANRLIPEGGIYQFNLRTGELNGGFVGGLYGPTDMAVAEDGLFVLEELAERISFVSWEGKQKIIWDGWGNPSVITGDPLHFNIFYAAENIPQALIHRLGDNLNETIELPRTYRNDTIAGLVKLKDGSFLVSLTNRGLILRYNGVVGWSVFSSEIFAPAKLVATADGSIYVLDPLLNQIVQLEISTGETLRTFIGKPFSLSDFDLDTGADKKVILYAMDNRNSVKLQYSETLKRFYTVEKIDAPDNASPVFTHIPDYGFLIAFNDEEGTLLGSEDRKEKTLLATQYKNIAQLIRNGDHQIAALSRDGWVRTFTFVVDNMKTPVIAETPRPLPTPISVATTKPTRIPSPVATAKPTSTNKQIYPSMQYPILGLETALEFPTNVIEAESSPTATPTSTSTMAPTPTYTPTITATPTPTATP